MHTLYTCAYCYQPNDHWVDVSAGQHQRYTEDCQVCCRPNLLHIAWDEWQETYTVEAEPELG
jgi:hypothetical protein